MNRLLLFGLLLVSSSLLPGQGNDPNSYNALSARVQIIDHGLLNEELNDVSLTYALEIGLRRQFGKYFGVSAPLRIGVIDVGEFENPVIVGLDLLAELYPLGTEGKISPYLLAGIGAVSESFEDANHQVPLGVGLNLLLGENSWLGIQGQYRISNQALRDHVQIGVGYTYRLSSLDNDKDDIVNRQDECPDEFGLPATNGCPDTDGDGLPDKDDLCPLLAGNASLSGCPDRDGDGITDAADQCPDTPGPAASGGCPDTDEDGIPDEQDDCPEEAGPETTNGCPDEDEDGVPNLTDQCPTVPGDPNHAGCPDTDGDGRYDHEDDCPTEAGTLPNGCPAPPPPPPAPAPAPVPEITEEVKEKLEFAAQAVEFETGSAKLKETSYVILSEIVAIMKQYVDYNLIIGGHTDDVGSDRTNLRLSEERARTCKDFLVATGISDRRISYAGYGESRPKADNNTAEGRSMNRRVEFELKAGR